MGKQGDCITIIRKDGKRCVVPLSTWENGLKLDTDWRIENRPLLNTPEVKVESVIIEKPVEKPVEAPPPVVVPVEPPKVEDAAPEVKAEPEKPKGKRRYAHKKKA
jgi:hypothetical protein